MASPPAAKPPAATITLAAPNTDAGAMERLFLLEAYSPGNVGNYVAVDNLTAMRLMRQTIENRLKSPADYGARGATTETDIVELGNQFAGFGSYPTLDAGMSANLTAILAIANNPRHPQQADYAQFVNDAITAATEAVAPPTAKYADVTAWRTAEHGPPQGRFKALETISGNTFYATTPVPPRCRQAANRPARTDVHLTQRHNQDINVIDNRARKAGGLFAGPVGGTAIGMIGP